MITLTEKEQATNFAQRINSELSPLEIQSLILLLQGTK